MLVNIIQEGPGYWAESVEHSTLDHGVISSMSMLNVEFI